MLMFLIGCEEKKYNQIMTENEAKLYQQMTLEYKVVFDKCYKDGKTHYDFTSCYVHTKHSLNGKINNGNNLIETGAAVAVGTAVGRILTK